MDVGIAAGIEVLADEVSEEAVATAAVVPEAVQMLRRYSPSHALWLTTIPRRLVILHGMKSTAAYDDRTRSILLASFAADRHDVVGVATLLVHEATHSRIAARGVRPHPNDLALRRRIERRCVTEQLLALCRMDAGHYLVPWSIGLLKSASGEGLTPSRAILSQQLQRMYRRLRSIGMPRVVARVVMKVAAITARHR